MLFSYIEIYIILSKAEDEMRIAITCAGLQITMNRKAVGQNPPESVGDMLGIDPEPLDHGQLPSYDHRSSTGASEAQRLRSRTAFIRVCLLCQSVLRCGEGIEDAKPDSK